MDSTQYTLKKKNMWIQRLVHMQACAASGVFLVCFANSITLASLLKN